MKKEKDRKSQAAKKEDLGWFSSSPKFGIPPVPTLIGNKIFPTLFPTRQNLVQDVCTENFLSASSYILLNTSLFQEK